MKKKKKKKPPGCTTPPEMKGGVHCSQESQKSAWMSGSCRDFFQTNFICRCGFQQHVLILWYYISIKLVLDIWKNSQEVYSVLLNLTPFWTSQMLFFFHPRLQWRTPTTEPVVQKPIQNAALLALCLQPAVVSGLPHAGTGSKNRAVAEGWSQRLGFGVLPLI